MVAPLMSSILKTIRRLAAYTIGALLPGAQATRVESDIEEEAQLDKFDLSIPGRFKTTRGQDFGHGLDYSSDGGNLHESPWIAFEGVRLRVSLYRQESGDGDRVTFCGKDAEGCPEARAWAARLQRANGVWFPRREGFARFCRKLGWSSHAVETMLEIYRA
jgi:hypothetical protein